jgi:tRNA U55 pseudouridine synthase TruB
MERHRTLEIHGHTGTLRFSCSGLLPVAIAMNVTQAEGSWKSLGPW